MEDAGGQVLAYIYGRDESIAVQAKGLTKDEARRIAQGITRLPDIISSQTGTDGR